MKRIVLIGAVCLGVWVSAPVRADYVPDPLRCEALQMRKEGQKLLCGAHCLTRAAWVEAHQVNAGAGKISACDQRCEDRYAAGLERIKQGPPCGPDPPDRERCAADLLNAEAKEMLCKSRCLKGSPDNQQSCAQDCVTSYETARDQILASDVCSDGAAGIP